MGAVVGVVVGTVVGAAEGAVVGTAVGAEVGALVGAGEGAAVGAGDMTTVSAAPTRAWGTARVVGTVRLLSSKRQFKLKNVLENDRNLARLSA